MLAMLVSCLFSNYIALLVFYDLEMFYIVPPAFYCQCSTSLCLSPLQLTLVTPFTSCTIYHLPWSSGRHLLKHNAPPLKTHLNTSLCTIDMISHSSIWPSWRMWALGGLGVPKKESITEINQTAREGRDRQQTSDDQCGLWKAFSYKMF